MRQRYQLLLNKFSKKAVIQVHHIDSKGQDSGVVYSEMQGRENTPSDLMAFRFVCSQLLLSSANMFNFENSTRRLLNPPKSAYRSETGGLMEKLRVLSVEQSNVSLHP